MALLIVWALPVPSPALTHTLRIFSGVVVAAAGDNGLDASIAPGGLPVYPAAQSCAMGVPPTTTTTSAASAAATADDGDEDVSADDICLSNVVSVGPLSLVGEPLASGNHGPGHCAATWVEEPSPDGHAEQRGTRQWRCRGGVDLIAPGEHVPCTTTYARSGWSTGSAVAAAVVASTLPLAGSPLEVPAPNEAEAKPGSTMGNMMRKVPNSPQSTTASMLLRRESDWTHRLTRSLWATAANPWRPYEAQGHWPRYGIFRAAAFVNHVRQQESQTQLAPPIASSVTGTGTGTRTRTGTTRTNRLLGDSVASMRTFAFDPSLQHRVLVDRRPLREPWAIDSGRDIRDGRSTTYHPGGSLDVDLRDGGGIHTVEQEEKEEDDQDGRTLREHKPSVSLDFFASTLYVHSLTTIKGWFVTNLWVATVGRVLTTVAAGIGYVTMISWTVTKCHTVYGSTVRSLREWKRDQDRDVPVVKSEHELDPNREFGVLTSPTINSGGSSDPCGAFQTRDWSTGSFQDVEARPIPVSVPILIVPPRLSADLPPLYNPSPTHGVGPHATRTSPLPSTEILRPLVVSLRPPTDLTHPLSSPRSHEELTHLNSTIPVLTSLSASLPVPPPLPKHDPTPFTTGPAVPIHDPPNQDLHRDEDLHHTTEDPTVMTISRVPRPSWEGIRHRMSSNGMTEATDTGLEVAPSSYHLSGRFADRSDHSRASLTLGTRGPGWWQQDQRGLESGPGPETGTRSRRALSRGKSMSFLQEHERKRERKRERERD